jgi:hypothetical protein
MWPAAARAGPSLGWRLAAGVVLLCVAGRLGGWPRCSYCLNGAGDHLARARTIDH